MRRLGQVARLKPDKVEEYRRLHADVWPQVLQTIADCNIVNYSIHIQDDLLFARFDYIGTDYAADMRRMEEDPVTQEWWRHTKPCFLHHDTGTYYQDMEEIFYFDPTTSST